MKICYLTHDLDLRTGCGIFSSNFISRVSRARPSWHIDVFVEKKSGHQLEKYVVPLNKWSFLFNIFRIRKILRQYDIVHALDGYPYGVVAVLSTLGLRKKILITGIGSGAINILSHNFFLNIVSYCYKHADTFFAVSQYTATKIKSFIPDLNVTIINHGVDARKFEQITSDTKISTEIDSYKPYILTVGSFKFRKGIFESVRAFAEVSKKQPDLKYVFIGDSNNFYGDRIKKFINKNGLQNSIVFIKNVSNERLRAFYRGAKIFILFTQDVEDSTDIEGFGLVFLEAAASGLPIISTTNSPAEDAVADGKNGILIGQKDIKGLGEAVLKIVSNEKLRTQMSRESITFAHTMSWEHVAEQYLPFYEKT